MGKLRLRKSARKDSERAETLTYQYYFSLVPKVFDIDGEVTVCKKFLDKEGNIIAGELKGFPKGHTFYYIYKDL